MSTGQRNWPSLGIVICALGLVMLQGVLLISALDGYALSDGRQVRMIPIGRLFMWCGWFITLLLAGLAIYPSRD